jgi:hypothetical protein
MEEFLIGVGIALLIALLAWSDQIQSMQRETQEAEKYLDEKRKINWKTIKKLIRRNASPEEKLSALNEMLTKQSAENISDIDIITHFRTLYNKSRFLERLYLVKYLLVIFLTFLFFCMGVVSFFISNESTFCLFNISLKVKLLPVLICILFSISILIFTIYLNFQEKKYRTDFINLMEDI